MCDYSLHNNPTRLATEGEQLVAYRFRSGSIGLASPADVKPTEVPAKDGSRPNWWASLRSWFLPRPEIANPVCAVCIPPGSSLYLRDIPKSHQEELGVGEAEAVTFIQVSMEEYVHRDGLRFPNGKQLLLQRLRDGQRVDVLSLTGEAVGQAERHAVHV